eukprot:COSAG06_NODE_1163_length_10454_cov_16.507677_10_plen_114_part_00
MGPYKPKKVRPSNLSANFVVSPVDSSEEEVRDKRIVCPLFIYIQHIIVLPRQARNKCSSRGKSTHNRTPFEQEEEELRLQEEAQAAAMLAVRKFIVIAAATFGFARHYLTDTV